MKSVKYRTAFLILYFSALLFLSAAEKSFATRYYVDTSKLSRRAQDFLEKKAEEDKFKTQWNPRELSDWDYELAETFRDEFGGSADYLIRQYGRDTSLTDDAALAMILKHALLGWPIDTDRSLSLPPPEPAPGTEGTIPGFSGVTESVPITLVILEDPALTQDGIPGFTSQKPLNNGPLILLDPNDNKPVSWVTPDNIPGQNQSILNYNLNVLQFADKSSDFTSAEEETLRCKSEGARAQGTGAKNTSGKCLTRERIHPSWALSMPAIDLKPPNPDAVAAQRMVLGGLAVTAGIGATVCFIKNPIRVIKYLPIIIAVTSIFKSRDAKPATLDGSSPTILIRGSGQLTQCSENDQGLSCGENLEAILIRNGCYEILDSGTHSANLCPQGKEGNQILFTFEESINGS